MKKLYPVILILFLTLIWEGSCRMMEIPEFILPTPMIILNCSIANFQILAANSLVTIMEIIAGITLSVLIAIPLSLCMFLFPTVEKTLSPLIIASQAIPVFAIAPLLVIWLGYGMASKVVMASVIIFFPVTVSLLEGFKSCEIEHIKLFRVMGARTPELIRYLYWPWALPSFFTGLKIGVSVATIGAVIGEWVGAQKGLGFLMTQSNARLEVDLLFAAIVWLSIIGLSLWKVTEIVEKRILKWKFQKTKGGKRK